MDELTRWEIAQKGMAAIFKRRAADMGVKVSALKNNALTLVVYFEVMDERRRQTLLNIAENMAMVCLVEQNDVEALRADIAAFENTGEV